MHVRARRPVDEQLEKAINFGEQRKSSASLKFILGLRLKKEHGKGRQTTIQFSSFYLDIRRSQLDLRRVDFMRAGIKPASR